MQTGVIMTLDLASVSGCAYGLPGALPRAITRRIAPPSTPIGQFLNAYRLWLEDMLTVHGPRILVFEAPILTAGKTSLDTARKLMGLACVTEMVAFERQVVHVYEADASTVCKFFTGRGNWGGREAKKNAVIQKCRQVGIAVADDNEADAVALWFWAQHRLFPELSTLHGPLFDGKAA